MSHCLWKFNCYLIFRWKEKKGRIPSLTSRSNPKVNWSNPFCLLLQTHDLNFIKYSFAAEILYQSIILKNNGQGIANNTLMIS